MMATTVASSTIQVRSLTTQPYAKTRDAMIAFTRTRDEGTPDEIWLLQHEPVFTLGQASRAGHLHGATDIPVVQTERGGQITYHGPGQLVAYLLIDLKRRGIKVREFVQLIEQAVVEGLAAYNLEASTKSGAPGVYVLLDDEWQKVAALGLKIVNGRSFHGLSLNVAMDLAPYASIDACGYPGLKTVDLKSLGIEAAVAPIGLELAAILTRRIEQASR